jgi:hypothetical protein
MNAFRSTTAIAAAIAVLALSHTPPASADEGDIGYPSVGAARTALAARDDVKLSSADGWMTIEDPAGMTLWTFAPEADPAHPAAIKRTVVQDGDRVIIRMDIRCEGDEAACDALEQHFLSLNQSVKDHAESNGDDASPHAETPPEDD